jgi:hypothetical protein
MKRSALLLLPLLLIPSALRADEASHKAKAAEMVQILHLDRMVNGVIQNALQQTTMLTSQRYGGTPPPAAMAALSDFQTMLTGVMEPQIGWDALKPECVRLFVAQFPEDQIDTMLTFYKSPAGQALLEKLPTVEQELGKLIQPRVQAMQPQVKQMFEDFQKSLPAPAPRLSAPPSGPPMPPTPAPAPDTKSTPK